MWVKFLFLLSLMRKVLSTTSGRIKIKSDLVHNFVLGWNIKGWKEKSSILLHRLSLNKTKIHLWSLNFSRNIVITFNFSKSSPSVQNYGEVNAKFWLFFQGQYSPTIFTTRVWFMYNPTFNLRDQPCSYILFVNNLTTTS